VVYIKVKNSAQALGVIASNFFDNPSDNIKIVAVTGTNGKTSIATLLYKLFKGLGYKVGLLSTVENLIDNEKLDATHTTPHAIAINALLSKMVEAGCDYCFMEASSHAIDQDRIHGLSINGAVFTNLTHDHLDYHGDFKNYLNAKKKLFDELSSNAFALINNDDKHGAIMLQNTKAKKYNYALQSMADYNAKILESHFLGMNLFFDGVELYTRMIGNFNAYNLLATYATAILLGENKEEVLKILSLISGAEGRFEYIISPKEKIVGIVDYAHTPDALKNVIDTINAVKTDLQKLIIVVGAGGNRDTSKRPIMAEIAGMGGQKVILTSDNPRDENPSDILEQMKKGLRVVDRKKALIIENREEAIRTAVSLANGSDVILVAGKGHEKYQEIKGIKHPFDDKEKLENAFKEMDR
jgi:UDP-N-acetylmuramoyl-L-alanyl-D-glutamate--2,6-diaminopimelate ligase